MLLQNGMIAIVDDEDYERVNQFKWAARTDKNNSVLKIYNSSEIRTTISLNRFILNLENEQKVIHKDGDELNFEKKNLVVVNQAIVTRKRRGNKNSSSNYKGVSWHSQTSKWKAQINVSGTVKHLGLFESESEAALTYNEAAIEYFGEYAYQNEIGKDNSSKNFEVANVSQKRKNNKLGYKGISLRNDKYQARVWNGEKFIYAGISKDIKEAARMHDRKAYEIHGDKAVLNFPELINEYKKSVIVPYSELRKKTV